MAASYGGSPALGPQHVHLGGLEDGEGKQAAAGTRGGGGPEDMAQTWMQYAATPRDYGSGSERDDFAPRRGDPTPRKPLKPDHELVV